MYKIQLNFNILQQLITIPLIDYLLSTAAQKHPVLSSDND